MSAHPTGRTTDEGIAQRHPAKRSVSRGQYRQLLAKYLRPQRSKVFLLAVLLLVSICLQLANPQILRYFIDTAKYGGSQQALTNAALLFLGIVFLRPFISAMALYFGEDVGLTATNLLRADLAAHCLRLDLSFHSKHTAGEMIERVDGDVTTLSNFFSQFAIRLGGNLLLLAGILLLLFLEDWRVGLLLTVFAILIMLVLMRVQGIAVPHFKASRQSAAELTGFWEERLSGLEDIRSSGASAYIRRRHHQLLRALMKKGRMSQVMGRVFLSTWELMFAVGNAAAFALGAYLFRMGSMTIGSVYLIFHYTGLLSWNLTEITQQLNDLQAATASLERIRELTETRSKIEEGRGKLLPEGALSVEFKDVSFSYASEGAILQGISFRLERGHVLSLLGRTGSGKTTLARLLFRFYSPQHGTIRIGGVDIRDADLVHLRGRIGMVSQDVQLFHASVRDNLTFFDRSVTDERLLEVIQELGLAEWLRALPEGLDTPLGAGGQLLSAGQAQLLVLTRVFLQDPGLVILDEASSRLDPLTERLLERSITKLLRNRTGIIIAHGLATVQRADEIMILGDGQILEHGTRQRLSLDSGSRFYHLLQSGMKEIPA